MSRTNTTYRNHFHNSDIMGIELSKYEPKTEDKGNGTETTTTQTAPNTRTQENNRQNPESGQAQTQPEVTEQREVTADDAELLRKHFNKQRMESGDKSAQGREKAKNQRKAADQIIRQMKDGQITPAEAVAQLENVLGVKLADISSGQQKQSEQSQKQKPETDEERRQKNRARAKYNDWKAIVADDAKGAKKINAKAEEILAKMDAGTLTPQEAFEQINDLLTRRTFHLRGMRARAQKDATFANDIKEYGISVTGDGKISFDSVSKLDNLINKFDQSGPEGNEGGLFFDENGDVIPEGEEYKPDTQSKAKERVRVVKRDDEQEGYEPEEEPEQESEEEIKAAQQELNALYKEWYDEYSAEEEPSAEMEAAQGDIGKIWRQSETEKGKPFSPKEKIEKIKARIEQYRQEAAKKESQPQEPTKPEKKTQPEPPQSKEETDGSEEDIDEDEIPDTTPEEENEDVDELVDKPEPQKEPPPKEETETEGELPPPTKITIKATASENGKITVTVNGKRSSIRAAVQDMLLADEVTIINKYGETYTKNRRSDKDDKSNGSAFKTRGGFYYRFEDDEEAIRRIANRDFTEENRYFTEAERDAMEAEKRRRYEERVSRTYKELKKLVDDKITDEKLKEQALKILGDLWIRKIVPSTARDEIEKLLALQTQKEKTPEELEREKIADELQKRVDEKITDKDTKAKAERFLANFKRGFISERETRNGIEKLIDPNWQEEKPIIHELPEFKTGTITEQDLKDLVSQAWDKEMEVELKYLFDDFKNDDGKDTASYYERMRDFFKRRADEQRRALQAKGTTPKKAPQSIKECKSIDDLAAYWRAKHNPNIVFEQELSQLYFPAVKEAFEGVEEVFKFYPDMWKKIQVVDAKAPTTFWGISHMRFSYSGYGLDMCLSFNKESFESAESVKETCNERRFVKNCSAKSLGAHEAGHALANGLLRRSGKLHPLRTVFGESSNINDSHLLFWASELLSPDKKTQLSKEELNKACREISDYALKGNGSETVAEAISDYITNGDKAAPLSKAIVQRIREALKGDTWRERKTIAQDKFTIYEKWNLTTATVAKWYDAHIAEVDEGKQTFEKLKSKAEYALYDRELADELSKIKSREEWEALLRSRTPNEEILEQDGLSDEKINELAKDSSVANVIKAFGGKIVNGKVQLDAQGKEWLRRHLENMINPTARFAVEAGADTETMNPVTDEKLNPVQKAVKNFCKRINVPIVFFKGDPKFHGKFENGVVYLNGNHLV